MIRVARDMLLQPEMLWQCEAAVSVPKVLRHANLLQALVGRGGVVALGAHVTVAFEVEVASYARRPMARTRHARPSFGLDVLNVPHVIQSVPWSSATCFRTATSGGVQCRSCSGRTTILMLVEGHHVESFLQRDSSTEHALGTASAIRTII